LSAPDAPAPIAMHSSAVKPIGRDQKPDQRREDDERHHARL